MLVNETRVANVFVTHGGPVHWQAGLGTPVFTNPSQTLFASMYGPGTLVFLDTVT